MQASLRQLLALLALFTIAALISQAQPTYAEKREPVIESTADSTDSTRDTVSDTANSDTATSDTATSDTAASDTANSDTATSDTAASDTAIPDTASDTGSDSDTDTNAETSSDTASDTASDTTSAIDTTAAQNTTTDTTKTLATDSATVQRDTSAAGAPKGLTPTAPKVEPKLTPREEAEKHYRVAMEYATDDSKVTEMIGELTLAIQADPDYAPPHLALGLYKFERKDYKGAEGDLKKAAELAPNDTTVLDNLGKLYLALRKRDDAEKVFVSAVAIDKNFMSGYRQLGDLYYREKRFEDAISALKTYTAKVKDDPGAHLRIGRAYRKLGKNDKAIKAYKDALAIDTEYAPAYSALGQIYLAEERFAEAVDAYGKSIKFNPKAYRSYFNLAVALQSAQPDSLQQSLAAWRQALRMARSNPRVTDIVPIAEIQIKELEKQIELRSKS